MTMSHPQSYEILLVPAFTDGKGAADKGAGTGTEDPEAKESDVQDPGTGDAGAGGPAADGTGDEGPDTEDPGGERPDTEDAEVAEAAEGAEEVGGAEDREGAEVTGSRVAGSGGPGAPIRSAVVAATGETGESGYPRYEGDGMVADIDPATHTVEALLIDGSELDYGLTVRISQRNVDG
ncbi:hypothetical protein E6R60_07780 [Streptomyces sp. A0642]|nr:hypothetical protein E6R60_07780 [Streptomyces sp. A0642]